MMEGLPIRRVGVPVESGSHTFHLNVEIVCNLLFDHLKGRRGAWVLRDQMSSLMPRNPFSIATLFGLLNLSHFVYEFVVK